MTDQIISKDVIRRQARVAAESDYKAGRVTPDCPYQLGTTFAKRWLAAYWERELELHQRKAA